MFDIVHLLIFFILGFFLPVIVGLEVSAHYKGTKIQKLCISYASGTFFLVALFEILQSINLFMGQSLKILAVTFLILSLFVCARNFVLYMDELVFFVEKTPIKKVIQSTGNETRAMFRSAEKFEYHAIGLFFVLMVGVQIFALVWFRDVQFGDNYFHTAAIVDAVETGKIWRVEPATGIDVYTFYWRHRFGGWDMYLAYLSYVTGITPAVFVYTLEPIMAILWVYSVIVCLGSELFKEKLKIRYFCALMSVLMLFGQYNFVSTNGYLMNLPWAGRGLLYGVCVLWVFYLTLHFFPDWNKKAKN
nr:hypothetical protein [Lachnospiraceae bacterium]